MFRNTHGGFATHPGTRFETKTVSKQRPSAAFLGKPRDRSVSWEDLRSKRTLGEEEISEPEPADDIVPLVPEATNKPEVPVSSGEIEYVVAKGDTFTSIARKHGVTVQAVIKANPAVDPARMAIGQVLVIPAKPPQPAKPVLQEGTTEYLVKAGDNLYNIAKSHNTTWKAIREANDLSTTAIRVGQKLIIPPPVLDE